MSRRTEFDTQSHQLINAKQWEKLIKLAEDYELDGATPPIYGIQLLAYYIVNDLTGAKFLWKRINQKNDAELVAVYKIGQSLWKKNNADFYKNITAFQWTPAHKTLVDHLQEIHRQKVVQLLSRAYTTISVTDAATALGLNTDQTVQALTKLGWQHDQANKMFNVVRNDSAKNQSTTPLQLDQLSSYFSFLEQ